MNIYDEAIIKVLYGNEQQKEFIVKTLERAKKVEELLEVYKGIDGGGSPEGLNKLYKLRDNLEKELGELK